MLYVIVLCIAGRNVVVETHSCSKYSSLAVLIYIGLPRTIGPQNEIYLLNTPPTQLINIKLAWHKRVSWFSLSSINFFFNKKYLISRKLLISFLYFWKGAIFYCFNFVWVRFYSIRCCNIVFFIWLNFFFARILICLYELFN